MSFLGEIKRRKVFQVASVYAVVAWLITQVIGAVHEPLNLPDGLDTVVIVLLAAGFPIALILAWAFELTPQGLRASSGVSQEGAAPPPTVQWFGQVSQVLVLLAVALLVADRYLFDDAASPRLSVQGGQRVSRFDYEVPEDQAFRVEEQPVLAISPDGRHFVYNTTDGIYLRPLEALEARLIAGTDERAGTPVFSPDGQSVAYATSTGQIKRIAISGGAAVTISGDRSFASGASWETDDTILFGALGGIYRVSADGGTPDLIISAGENEQLQGPELLPDGDSLLFSVVAAGDWDAAQIAVQSLSSDERTMVLPIGRDPHYLSTGHLVYGFDDGLYAIAFDVESLAVSGDAVPVQQGIMRTIGAGRGNYAVSNDGTLVYLAGSPGNHGLVWVDRDGREQAISIEPSDYNNPRISPDADGTRVVLDDRIDTAGLWVFNFADETRSPLDLGGNSGAYPAWTPDGEYIAYSAGVVVAWKAANNTVTPDRLSSSVFSVNPYFHSRSPSGMKLVFRRQNPDTRDDIGMIEIGSDAEPVWLLNGTSLERNAELSPNGRWMAYQSDESGEWEIYVRPFPDVDGDSWTVSNAGGQMPLWSREGRELFYLEPGEQNPRLMSVAVEETSESTFSYGTRTPVFDYPYFEGDGGRSYDVSPDGQRFLMLKALGGAADTKPQIIIVQNWFEELERLVPTE